MRLYRILGDWPYYVGTQAEAKRDAPAKGQWEEVDVPTDKPGLIEWLNTNATNYQPRKTEQGLTMVEVLHDDPEVLAQQFNPKADEYSDYKTPWDARTTMAGMDTVGCITVIRQLSGENLAKLGKAYVERITELTALLR